MTRPQLNKLSFICKYTDDYATFEGRRIIIGVFKLISKPGECQELTKKNYKGFIIDYKFRHPLSILRKFLQDIGY
jgi:hypothetical protein